MESKLKLIYMSSLIFYFINFGKTQSDGEDEELVGGGKHKWSTDEEFKLIFFDVLTDTGEPGHFDRIKAEWHREFPETSVTDSALRNKVHRLRWESVEGERKRYFKWDEGTERELMDVYLTTHPYKRDANVSLQEEWKRRHPEYQGTRKHLLWLGMNLLKKYKRLRYKKPGTSKDSSRVKNMQIEGGINHHWTEDEKASLLYFYNLTDTGEHKQFDRIKLMWREKYRGSNLTDASLFAMLRKIRGALRKKGERRSHLKWTPEEERMLLNTYFNTYPQRKNVNVTFEEAWKQRQKISSGTIKYIGERARKLIRENKYPEFSKRGAQAESSKVRSRKQNNYVSKKRSLRKRLEGVEPEKRHGKAPMVYSSDESRSPSPSIMSGHSK